MLFLSFITSFLTYEAQDYSLYRTTTFNTERFSINRKIPYFVSKEFKFKDVTKSSTNLYKYEKDVEKDFLQKVFDLCKSEKELLNRKIYEATGWFSNDKVKLKQAKETKQPNCLLYKKYI